MPRASKGKPTPAAKRFKARLERLRSSLNWIVIYAPFDAAKLWGLRGQIKVKGEINGFAFRTSLFPTREGRHFLLVNKRMQKGARAFEGSVARFRMEFDSEKRIAPIPKELTRIFQQDRSLRRWYDALNQSTRNDIAKWITDPKTAEARVRRAEQIAERLLSVMEAERELPPILRVAFARHPRAREGWDGMTVCLSPARTLVRHFLLPNSRCPGAAHRQNAGGRDSVRREDEQQEKVSDLRRKPGDDGFHSVFDRLPLCIAQCKSPRLQPQSQRMSMKFRFSAIVTAPVMIAPVIIVQAMLVLGIGNSLAAQGSSPQAGAAKRAITEKDLFSFVWIADPQVSPDGSHALFTRVVTDEKRTGYETSIWMVATSGNESPVRLTNGKHDAHGRWSPDGKRIAFVRGGDKDDTGKPRPAQIAILSLTGGEARLITELPKGTGGPVWSPDSRRIAFSSSTTQEDIDKEQCKKNEAKAGGANIAANTAANAAANAAANTAANTKECPPKADSAGDHESDIHIIMRAVYRDNEEGYLDFKRHAHVWVIEIPTTSDEPAKPVQLTSGDYDEHDIVWTQDGSRIYFLTRRIDEPYYETGSTDIYSVASTGGAPEKLATIPMGIGDLTLSPDGRRVAFHGSVSQPVRSYSQPDLWVMDLTANAQPRNLTASYDFDMGSSVFGDNAAPRGGSGADLYWSPDGRWIFDTVAKQGRTPLVRVDAETGAVTEITHGDQAVLDFSITPDARTTVALVSTPVMIGDLFTVSMRESQSDGQEGAQSRITDPNQALWSQLNLTAPEEINYKSFDGLPIQGWIQKPPDFDPKKKYPLILDIHGGPHAAYGWVFDHEFQWMAAKGYVVLYINPRGSTSYGQDFGNIIQYHYPGDDYRDLMVGVDEVLKRGYVDPKRLGVTGGSGGGVLTDWAVTQTDRFAAAVSQRDISNWASWWYTADFTLFQPRWFKAPPFQDPKDYADRSAITFVEKIHTPMMFILGQSDYRTPQDSGGEQLFRALKYLKRPTAMVVFPRETHELSRSGEPWHRIERLDNIVGWFDKWLMGVPHPEYEVRPDKQATKSGDQ